MGAIGGALGGLLVALAILNKFNDFPKMRWTIKSVLLGIGAGLLAKNQAMLGVMLANVVIFALVFGVIGIVIDLIKNQNTSAKSTEQKAIDASNKNSITTNISSTKTEVKMPEKSHNATTPSTKDFSVKNLSIDESKIWEIVADEFDSEFRNKGLFAKCFTEALGDEAKTKAFYYKARFEELLIEQKFVAQQLEIEKVKEQKESEPFGEGRNGRQSLSDIECLKQGYCEKLVMNGYECFDLDNGKAVVVTPKRILTYKSMDALKKAMLEQKNTGVFKNAYKEKLL